MTGRAAVVALTAVVGAACSSGGGEATTTTTTEPPIVDATAADAGELAAQVCGDASEPDARLDIHDLDADGHADVIASTTCGDETVGRHGVFLAAPGELRPIGDFRGDDLTVLVGDGITMATVVPVTGTDGGDAGLVERVVRTVTGDGELEVVERRQMPLAEYLADFAPADRRITPGEQLAQWRAGVALVEPVTCWGSGSHGSGFLVEPDLVVTNNHVVDGAVLLRVEVAGEVHEGTVLAADARRDLALVRLRVGVDGHVFPLAADAPEIGEDATALGFPLGRQYSLTRGEVSGTGRRFQIADSFYENAIQISTPINPGNSGGPLLDAGGAVLGVNAAGNRSADNVSFAIPAAEVARLVADPGLAPPKQAVITPGCQTGAADIITSSVVHVDLPPVLHWLDVYVFGINNGAYREAWDVNAQSLTGDEGAFERFRSGVETSFYDSFEIEAINRVGDRAVEVDARLRTYQSPEFGPDGSPCTDWHLRYPMAENADGVWRIGKTQKLADPAPCPENDPAQDVGD